MFSLVGRQRLGNCGGLSHLGEPLIKIQTTDVECQFPSQRVEETINVVSGLAGRVSDQVDAAVPQITKRPRPGFIARMKSVGVDWSSSFKDAFDPIPVVVIGLVQE